MSDHDRLADYLRRMEDAGYERTLPDGCNHCGQSIVSCNCSRYIEAAPCCPGCSH